MKAVACADDGWEEGRAILYHAMPYHAMPASAEGWLRESLRMAEEQVLLSAKGSAVETGCSGLYGVTY